MKLLKPFIFAILLSSCATISHGPQQRVIVSTPGAPHAECTLTSTTLGTRNFITPEAINIPRSSETINVSCRKKCFDDVTKTFGPIINGEDLAVNGVITGLPPVAIDAATGRAYNYSYDFVITMKSNHKCSPNRKGFLQGNKRDFDNQIRDFKFDELVDPLPDTLPDPNKTNDTSASENTKSK